MTPSAARAPRLSFLLAAPGLLVACDQGEARSVAQPTDTSTESLDAPSRTPEGSVRCSYNYRQSSEVMAGQTGAEPAFQFEERVLAVAAGEDASATLGQLTFSVGYHLAEHDADTVSLRVATDAASVLSILYQLGSGLPQNQFLGGHGFTGLLYFTHPDAGGDYQAYCEAVR